MNANRPLLACILSALVLLAATGAAPAAHPRLAQGDPHEIRVVGDFDGDGVPDLAVIRRDTGLLRVGYGIKEGGMVFHGVSSAGAHGVTWAVAAPMTVAGRDQLLLFAPDANRVQLLDLHNPGSVLATPVYATGTGPRTGAALELAGSGSPHLDILVHNQYTTVPGVAGMLRAVRNTGSGFEHTASAALAGLLDSMAAITPASGQPELAAWIRRGDGQDLLEVWQATTSTFTPVDAVSGLPSGARYTCGFFDAPRLDFFLYVPGQSMARARRLDGSPGSWAFGPEVLLNFGSPLASLTTILGTGGTCRLLAVFANGSAATAVYTGTKGLGVLRPVTLPAGQAAAHAVWLADGQFLILAPDPAGGSGSWFHYSFDGAVSTLLDTGSLPALEHTPAGANVWVYNAPPFRDSNAMPLGAFHAFDWTTAVDLDAAPGWLTVSGLRFVDSATGLGDPSTGAIAPAPGGAAASLFNQYHPQISLGYEDAPLGILPVLVAADPPGGHYPSAVQVTLHSAKATHLYWRSGGSGHFVFYTGPVALFRDTLLEFYGSGPDGISPLYAARYTFAAPPEHLDSDGDGVPDFVELDMGLDPTAGSDSDGDGFSDLEEILAGTDPADPKHFPETRPDLGDRLVLHVTPQPYDYIYGGGTTAAPGTEVRVHDTAGTLLGLRVTGHAPAYPHLATVVCQPVAPQTRALVVATPQHHDMDTADSDTRRGREMVAALPAGETPQVVVDFDYNPDDPAAQPEAWRKAAKLAYAAAARPPLSVGLDFRQTLRTVLAERALEPVFAARGLTGPGIRLVLTPFRIADAGEDAYAPDAADLALLEQHAGGVPAIRIDRLLDELGARVFSPAPDPAMADMLLLAAEIYRISAEFHNSVPGELPAPIDTLRASLETGLLPASYASRSVLDPGRVVSAAAAAHAIAADPPGQRPFASFIMDISGAGGSCTLATDVVTSITYALRAATGAPYQLPDNWSLLPGTRLTVLAFTDAPDLCGYPALEIITIAFRTLSLPAPADADGDLLADSWELFHFGHLAHGTHDDPSGSGYSLAEEFLSGTDPNDLSDVPPVPPVRLELSPVVIEPNGSSDLVLSTSWPAHYADRIQVVLHSSDDLVTFTESPLDPEHDGAGRFTVEVPAPAPRAFHRLSVRLAGAATGE